MALKYKYSPRLNIVNARPYGEHSSLDVFNYFNELINSEEIKHGFISVVDFENVDHFLFDTDEGGEIAQMHTELQAKKNIRATVFIAKNDLNYGIARMMQILHDLNDPAYDVFVVSNQEEANNILKKIVR